LTVDEDGHNADVAQNDALLDELERKADQSAGTPADNRARLLQIAVDQGQADLPEQRLRMEGERQADQIADQAEEHLYDPQLEQLEQLLVRYDPLPLPDALRAAFDDPTSGYRAD
jgi:hypothetical protein